MAILFNEESFASLVRPKRILWDHGHPKYKNTVDKTKCFEELAAKFSETSGQC